MDWRKEATGWTNQIGFIVLIHVASPQNKPQIDPLTLYTGKDVAAYMEVISIIVGWTEIKMEAENLLSSYGNYKIN